MSKTGVVKQVTRESKRPVDLPAHLESWFVDDILIGDATGGIVHFKFGFDLANTTREWYVAISSSVIFTVSSMDTMMQAQVTDFAEWDSATLGPLVGLEGTGLSVSSQYQARLVPPDKPVYLGRVKPRTDGRVNLTFATNTNTNTYIHHTRGYISERPFMLPMWYSK